MKKLQLSFKTAEGKSKNLVLNYVKDDLDAQTVKDAMSKISASKLFEKDDIKLYQEAASAKYIERVEKVIF
ncbi:DUF2922 domain-containing protein [Companilactobacillus metriopterae]|uniref:DUF2922 domain-containing protein n=1 Tax=Companilactobacillus metriopterae TaxID=1909267 RepID=UPI00100A2977|nr:DUF2922 domain-containing protein [Companilactobacillus metriopterae]